MKTVTSKSMIANNSIKMMIAICLSSVFFQTSSCMNHRVQAELEQKTIELITSLGTHKNTEWMWTVLLRLEEEPQKVYDELYPLYVKQCQEVARQAHREAVKDRAESSSQEKHAVRQQLTTEGFHKVGLRRDDDRALAGFLARNRESRSNPSPHGVTDFYSTSVKKAKTDQGRGDAKRSSTANARYWDLEASFCLEVAREVHRLERPKRPVKAKILDQSDSESQISDHDEQDSEAAVLRRLKEIEAYATVALLMGAKTSVFYLAVTWGDCAVVRYLLETAQNSAKLLAGKDDAGFAPLHWAAAVRRADMVQLLLDYGADKNVVDNKGRTPSEVAQLWGYNDIVKLIT